MSWFLNEIGTTAAVKRSILAKNELSATLKAAFVEIIEAKPWGPDHNGIRIAGNGHCGDGASIEKLTIERVAILKDSSEEETLELKETK